MQLDEWVLCRIYKKNSSAQKQLSSVSSKEHSNNGSSSSSSSHLDDMLDSFPELDDRFFALPRMNSLKTGFLNDDQKMGFQNLGSGSLDWATLAGLNSVPELVPSGQSHSQSQGIPSYGNTNDVYVPTMPTLCQMDTSTNKVGNSVEQEVQSGLRTHQRVGNSGFFQQNSSSLTQNFSNSTDPYGFRYPTQPGGFGFRQ